MRGITSCLSLATAALLIAAVSQAQETHTCLVRYVSADHAYLDAGRAGGLSEGITVTVSRDGQEVAVLVVEYVAEHSGACRLDPADVSVLPGDVVAFVATIQGPGDDAADEPAAGPPPRNRTRAEHVRAARAAAEGPRLAGSLVLQWEHVDDTSDADLDFDQPGLRYDVRVDRLGGGIALRARGSLRRELRTRSYAFGREDEWRNRLREFSLTRLDEDADWQMAVGRVGARVTAAVGPFDGVMVNRNVGGGWRLGAFTGLTPDWDSAATWTDDRLAGLVAHLRRGDRLHGRLDLSLVAVSRRRAGEIDRDYLALSGTWQRDRLSLTHAAQLDLNRGWRRDADDHALILGNVMISGRWRPDDRLRLSLTLDDREPVRSWSNRSLPDSLFEDAGRRGLRAGVAWRAGRASVSANGGLRRNDRYDDPTASYRISASHRDWPASGLAVGASIHGYDGPTSRGVSPSLRLTQGDRAGGTTRLALGSRTYELTAFDRRSTGRWLSVAHDRSLGRAWSASLEARWDGGDDTAGSRFFFELRRRL